MVQRVVIGGSNYKDIAFRSRCGIYEKWFCASLGKTKQNRTKIKKKTKKITIRQKVVEDVEKEGVCCLKLVSCNIWRGQTEYLKMPRGMDMKV